MAEHGIWMPMYWADYFKDTLEFSTFQHGCYMLLIGAYWERGSPLPDDLPSLARICRTTPDKLARYGKSVFGKFTRSDGLLRHERIENEILRSGDRLAAARANGRAGGLAKSKLTTITTTIRKKPNSSFGLGRGGMSDDLKLGKFQSWLAKGLGKYGWQIVGEACDPESPKYGTAVAFCQQYARENGKGWPHAWPKPTP